MTTAYTSLLGLALPVTGELSGTWGDVVNNAITSLVDSSIAGTTALSTDVDVTLTSTTGAANQARQAIILCSGARTAVRTITAPAQSKLYTVINNTTGGYSVKVVGAGPTTGVTIAAGATANLVWNGSDFIQVGITTFAPIASPAFTGTPTAPTAAVDTNTTQLATTAYVINQGYLKSTDAASTYLTITSAASTYLTQSNAASTYLTQSNAASTYLTQSNAASTYLTSVTAASTYQTQAGMSAYLTTASAASTYLTQSNAASTYLTQSNAASTYLTSVTAASTYQTQAGMSSYLTTATAASTYQTQAGMSSYAALSGAAFTGSIKEAKATISASNIDLSTGNYFTKTISGTTTFTVSNTPSSGTVASFILDITNGGSAAVNWWSNVKWPGGATPGLTVSGRDSLGFYTYDGGSTWTGLVLGKDIK